MIYMRLTNTFPRHTHTHASYCIIIHHLSSMWHLFGGPYVRLKFGALILSNDFLHESSQAESW